VAGYQPGREVLHAAQQLSRAFRYNPVSEQQRDIDAIYLMGSVGSFACNASSDLDIWLCHRPGLDDAAVDRLRRKAQRIARWAAELDLDLHFFVFDCDSFRRGEQSELSSESSGSAQHGLLLDEFYRTGLLLAGRYPIWWLTPPELELHHAEHAEWLRQRRFIDAREVIDFGSVARVPSEEFLGAGIWQLFKSIDAPYKVGAQAAADRMLRQPALGQPCAGARLQDGDLRRYHRPGPARSLCLSLPPARSPSAGAA
jgi:adenylate cyclase class 1